MVNKAIILVLSFLILCMTISIAVQGDSEDKSPWSSLMGNERNTSLSPYDTSHVDGTIKWRHNFTGDPIFSHPLIDSNGMIYITSFVGVNEPKEVFVFSQDGDIEHHYSFDLLSFESMVIGDEDTIYFIEHNTTTENNYVTSRYSNLTAFNVKTGETEWRYPFEHFCLYLMITSEDEIYFFDYEGTLHALGTDGVLRWIYKHPEGIPMRLTPGVDYANENIIIGVDDYILSVNLDGNLKWSSSIEGRASSPTIDDNGNIYITYYRNATEYIHSIDHHGEFRWKYPFEGKILYGRALGPDGIIYVTGGKRFDNSYLWALSPDGSLKWVYDIGYYEDYGLETGLVVGTDGRIYFGDRSNIDAGGTLFAVNPDGTLAWEREFDDSIGAIAIGPSGDLFVTSCNSLYRIGGQAEEKDGIPSIGSLATLSMIVSTAVIFSWRRRKLKPRGDRTIAKRA